MTGRLGDWVTDSSKCKTTTHLVCPPFQDTLCLCRASQRSLRIKTDAGADRHSSTKVPSSLQLFDGLDLLSSTPGITVVGGFPFIASPESPCASEARSLFLAGNGRTSTAPSRQ